MPVDPNLDLLPAFEDFGKWTDSLPEPQKASILKHFEFVPDEEREAEQKHLLSVGMISQRTGIDPAEVSQNFESHYMPRFAADSEVGLGLSETPKDVNSFYDAVKKKLMFDKAANDAANEAFHMAIDPTRPSSATVIPASEKGPIPIDRGLQAFNQWKGTDEAKAAHAATFLKGWNAGQEKLALYRDKIDELKKLGASINDGEAMTKAMEGESALETSPFSKMARIMMEIPKADRPIVLSVLAKQSASGDKTGDGNRLFLELGRGFNELFSEGTDKLGRRALHYLGLEPNSTEYHDFMDLRDDVREAAYGGAAKIDPVKLMGANLSGVARNAPMTIGAFVPYLGPLAMTGQFQRDTANELRQQNPNMPRDVRERVADISAPFQALSEVVSDRLLLGRLPNLRRVFTMPAFTASSIAKQAVGRLALGTSTETAEELFQQATPKMVMATLGALGQDMPDTDWGQFGTDFVKKTPELLSVIVPMVLLGGGIGSISDYAHGKDLARDKLSLIAAGYNQEGAERISGLAKAGDWRGTEQAMRQEWSRVNAQSAPLAEVAGVANAKVDWVRRKLTQEAQELVSTHLKEGEELMTHLVNSQMIPDIEKRDGKYVLTDRFDGSTASFNSWDDARDAATHHMNETERNSAELVAAMADKLMLGKGESMNIRQNAETMGERLASGQTSIEDAMASAVTGGVLKGLTVTEARAMAGAVFGENPDDRQAEIRKTVEEIMVLGSNVADGHTSKSNVNFKMQVNGEHVVNPQAFMDAVEEPVEGRWKNGVANGHFTKAQGVSWVKLAEAATGEQFLHGMTHEEVLTSPEATPRALTEAISSIVTADVFGRLQNGKRIAPGQVSRGLDLNDKQQSAFAALLKAFGDWFKHIMDIADKLIMARQKFTPEQHAEYDAIFDKLTGADGQHLHETEAAKEADAIANEVLYSGGESYSEANPGPNGETFSVRPVNLTEAESHLRSLAGKEMTTADGLKASISNNTASKMVSASAARKSASTKAHLAAIGSFEELFTRGTIKETGPDRVDDPNITAVHRVFSSMEMSGADYSVKFTVKELARGLGNRIYSIEAIDVSAPPAGQLAHDTSKETARGAPIADGTTDNPSAPGKSQETHSVRKFDFSSRLGPAADTLAAMKKSGKTVDFNAIYKAVRLGKSTDWQTLDDLYAEAQKTHPKLTEAEFGRQIQALYDAGHVLLEPGDHPDSMRAALGKYGLRDSLGIPSMYAGPSAQDTHSIRSGDFSSRMSAAFLPFQRSPELRLAIAKIAKDRAQRLGAEWIEKAAELRGAGSIGKEAHIREAMAYETRMNEYLDGLTPAARQDLEFEPSKLESDPLIHAMLDHGKLMSRSTAMQQGKLSDKAGEYDGIPWLPPSWYSKGAGIMPDQMAQAMHDAGLLKDAHVDTLWQALAARIESSRKDKASAREAAQSFKAAQKYARDASRAEADKWADGAKKKAGSPKAQREMLKAALRTLDGILSAAPPEVRARVGGYVKLAGLATDEAMLKEIEARIEKLNVELEKWLKKEGREQLEKLLKKGRPTMDSGKKGKGKDSDMHHLFAAAEKASKMDAAAVAGELARLDSLIAGDTLTPEQETLATTERGLVELLGDLKNADSGRIFSAIDTLRSIYDGAWLKWKLSEIERKERRAGMRQDFITDTGKTGLKPERDAADKAAATLLGKIKGVFLSLSSFHEVLSYAFGAKSDRVKSLVDAERAASGQYEDVNQALADEVEALFTEMGGGTLKGERLRFDMAQRTIKTAKGELSQLEAIQALLMWRQEDGQRHMEGHLDESGKPMGQWHYDQAWIDEITAALTPEARRVMGWIMQKYGAEWATLNPLYRSRYGVNMPAHDNYAPITVAPMQTKAGEVVDPVTGAAMSSGSILTPGSLRTRSRSAIAEPEFRDALQTLLIHTRQLEYWKAYYDLAVEANAILGNREVLNAVKAKGGEPAATALRKWVDAIAQGGFRDASASLEMSKLLNRMKGRAATVGLLGRVSTLLVQSTQLAAAAVKMPMGRYLVGMSKLLTGNLGYGDALKSDFIQRRYKNAPPIVRQAMENLGAQTKPNAIKHAARSLGQLLSGADALFTAGTYALLLDYHRGTGRAMGLSGTELETHAHTEAERDTEQVAQPTRMATRSLAEITMTNPLGKVTWAYASEARQKIALFAWSATQAKSDFPQFLKTSFLTFGVGGLMTQLLKNLWKEAKGDDDQKKWTPERLVMDMLSSPLHGIPVVGALMNDGNMLSGASHLKNVDFKGDATDIMRGVDTALSVLGMFNDTAASVAALSHAGLDAAKVLENLTSDK